MEVGDIIQIHMIPFVKIKHPCFARVQSWNEHNVRCVLVAGSYDASGRWLPLGHAFQLVRRNGGSEWTITSEDDAPGEYWAAIALQKLTEGHCHAQ